MSNFACGPKDLEKEIEDTCVWDSPCIGASPAARTDPDNGPACRFWARYTQALAVFWYLENRNENWKTSGMRDEDIVEVNFRPAGATKELEDATR